MSSKKVEVDIIVPVHNAAATLEATIASALNQVVPAHLEQDLKNVDIDIAVCCFDDGSTDDSAKILNDIKIQFESSAASSSYQSPRSDQKKKTKTSMLIARNEDGVARGAGYARNRASEMRPRSAEESYICLLDSDDICAENRVAEQLAMMRAIPSGEERDGTLLGSTFNRLPEGSTANYSSWANSLTDERLMLDRFRECTLIQPTWFLTRDRFEFLEGYVEAPHKARVDSIAFHESNGYVSYEAKGQGLKRRRLSKLDIDSESASNSNRCAKPLRMIHPTEDNSQTLRLAEDLRFFHEHLYAGGTLKMHRHVEPDKPLVTYMHNGSSQSYATPRKLLLALRTLAFEIGVLKNDDRWKNGFVIWGAGRDGKHFLAALS